MEFGIAVKGIIRRKDGKILVVKRVSFDDHKPGIWETVGGGVDEGEKPQETIKREAFEEAGIGISVGEPFNVFTFTKDTGETKIGITFLCEHESGEVVLSEEHTDYKWIEPKEFAELESIPSLYEEINDYAKKHGK